MGLDDIKKIFSQRGASSLSTNFFPYILKETLAEKRHSYFWERMNLGGMAFLYYYFEISGIQDGLSYISIHLAKALASFLFMDEDFLTKQNVAKALAYLEKEPCPFFPKAHPIALEHIILCLKELSNRDDLIFKINQFSLPLANSLIEKRIKESLSLIWSAPLTSREVRVSVLASLLTPLRQKVGSCFATAPAIRIQSSQIGQYLEDMQNLISRGKLTRIIEGIEYSVPFSPGYEGGDLNKIVDLEARGSLIFSPGLIHALCHVGVIPKHSSFSVQAKRLEALLIPIKKHSPIVNIRELLKEILLDFYHISKEELQSFEQDREKKARLMISHASKIEKKAENLIEALQQAQSIFQGFTDHPLLKSWEYTIASLADYKVEFYRWNLFSSLGFHHEEKGGIGEKVYQYLKAKLAKSSEESQDLQKELERSSDQARSVEALISHTTSYDQFRRLKAELQTHRHHMHTVSSMREESYEESRMYASLYNFLLEKYTEKFQEYFQEIYDPNLFEQSSFLFSDSPAGFRLVYKHGRLDPSLWTLIRSEEEFVDCLIKFFQAVEPYLLQECPWEKGQKEIEALTTLIIHHVHSQEFMQSAYERMAAFQEQVEKKKLSKEEKVNKKPWSYISGGTIHTLLKCYYQLDQELEEETTFIENDMDLCIFIADVLKALPYHVVEPFEQNNADSFLMYSPSHAFLLKPGYPEFQNIWEDKGFTYTYIRDFIVQPGKQFYSGQLLEEKAQEDLARFFLIDTIPKDAEMLLNAFSPHAYPIPPPSLKKIILKAFSSSNIYPHIEASIDGFMRKALPLVKESEWKELAETVLEDLPYKKEIPIKTILKEIPSFKANYLPFYIFYYLLKSVLYFSQPKSSLSFDMDIAIQKALALHHKLPPKAIRLGDTNWPNFLFAFLVNPGTMRFELWRTDAFGLEGAPMTAWRHHLNGAIRAPWGVFTNPKQYSLNIR